MATAVIRPLTREEVRIICEQPEKAGKAGLGESLRGDFSGKLGGRTVELSLDGTGSISYSFESGEKLSWSDGGSSRTEYAQILELGDSGELYLVNHLRAGSFPLENVTLILDFSTGLCTMILARLGDAARPRDVEQSIYFGRIKDNPADSEDSGCRHDYTDELVHKIIDWHYDDENIFIVKHLYVSTEHMVYYLAESAGSDKGLVEAAECAYIKVRDNIYIMSWLEKGHQGMQGVVLMDTDAMHDVGSFFGISILDRLDNYTFAAKGEYSGL